MKEIRADDFIKKYILDPTDAEKKPLPVTEPILINGLFTEIAGKDSTMQVVANDVIGDADIIVLPTKQQNDDTQLYSFVLEQLEFLEIYYNKEISEDYVRHVNSLAEKLLCRYENARGLLLAVVYRYASVAFFSICEEISRVFTKERAKELLRKNRCIIDYIRFVDGEYMYKNLEDEEPMWKTDLLGELDSLT